MLQIKWIEIHLYASLWLFWYSCGARVAVKLKSTLLQITIVAFWISDSESKMEKKTQTLNHRAMLKCIMWTMRRLKNTKEMKVYNAIRFSGDPWQFDGVWWYDMSCDAWWETNTIQIFCKWKCWWEPNNLFEIFFHNFISVSLIFVSFIPNKWTTWKMPWNTFTKPNHKSHSYVCSVAYDIWCWCRCHCTFYASINLKSGSTQGRFH